MRKQKVATGFTSYAENALLVKSQTIVASMTDNPVYPTPTPTLADVGTAISNYNRNLSATPSKENTQEKKQNRLILIEMLNYLSLYVTSTGGSPAEWESSGFSLTSVPQPVGVLAKPQNFTVKPFQAGSVKLSLKKIAGADGYCFQYAQVIAGEPLAWVSVQSTKTKITIAGLVSGAQYAFRVYGIGSNPTIVYSDQVNSFVL
jgi:hypothetical protein